jgi:hypothetical protein
MNLIFLIVTSRFVQRSAEIGQDQPCQILFDTSVGYNGSVF